MTDLIEQTKLNDIINEESLYEYEQEIKRDPYSFKAWWSYINVIQQQKDIEFIHLYTNQSDKNKNKIKNIIENDFDKMNKDPLILLYERALTSLPRSYKIWRSYISYFNKTYINKEEIIISYITDNNELNNNHPCNYLIHLYEKSVFHLPTFPRLWINYILLLIKLNLITKVRQILNVSLRSLPITQHYRLWDIYINYINKLKIPCLTITIYKRYLMLLPEKRENYIDILLDMNLYKEASIELYHLLNEYDKINNINKTKHELYMEFCNIITHYPEEIYINNDNLFDVESILRSGMREFKDEVGTLWCSLANYYLHLGLFEKARDIYEEGINNVLSVRDFSLIFDAYIKFLEANLYAEIADNEENDENNDNKIETNNESKSDKLKETDRLLLIFEKVVENRPLLLNGVLLRRSPYNVKEWKNRIHIYNNIIKDPSKVLLTYAEAVKTISTSHKQENGKLYTLWVHFAKFYEANNDISSCRLIFEKAINVNYKDKDDLAHIYKEYAEMEIRQEEFDKALDLIKNLCFNKNNKASKSVILWDYYLDLEESLSDDNNTIINAYEYIFGLNIVTPKMVINYANFLYRNKYFEKSFNVYERGLTIFPFFPHCLVIYDNYLNSFTKRYEGKKIERTRELYKNLLIELDKSDQKSVNLSILKKYYLMYANYEEKYGMTSELMKIYDNCISSLLDKKNNILNEGNNLISSNNKEDEKYIYEVLLIYISKAQEYMGIPKTREVFSKSCELLENDTYITNIVIKFSNFEINLHEIDRAREIFIFGSQYCDPRVSLLLWEKWHDFEASYGNEQTFLEMLRIKRSISMQYSQVNYITNDLNLSSTNPPNDIKPKDVMEKLENEKSVQIMNETDLNNDSNKRKSENNVQDDTSSKKLKINHNTNHKIINKEEIDIDMEFEEKEIPAAVLGNVINEDI